jgi:hypothetical protein
MDSNLLRGYNKPDEICKSCKHYFGNMKLYDVPRLQAANDYPDFKEGQKFCIKHCKFVYFNDYCVDFVKPD